MDKMIFYLNIMDPNRTADTLNVADFRDVSDINSHKNHLKLLNMKL
jgi:hypothetical protein